MTILRTAISAIVLSVALQANAGEYKQGEVIVKYKNNTVRTAAAMTQMYKNAGIKKVKFFGKNAGQYEHLVLKSGTNVESTIAQLEANPMVEYAQPNYILSLPSKVLDLSKDYGELPACVPGLTDDLECDASLPIPCIPGFIEEPYCDPKACLFPGIPFPPGCEGGGIPFPIPGNPGEPTERPALQDPPADVVPPMADPNLAEAWGLAKVHAPEAWLIHQGTHEMLVADIDTGIDYNHEDLAFNVWRNPNPTNQDIVGFDFIHNDGLPYDDQGHGTHTAGTIGATLGNGKGVAGVAGRVSIMALKFLSAQGSGETSGAIQAIDYAIAHGAKVMSNSWGGPGDPDNQALQDSIERARTAGRLFVAAAGNDSVNNDSSPRKSFPAAFDNDNIISVAATDRNDRMAFFSNYGVVTTDLGAPGVGVYSTLPNGEYKAEDGTSMACPHVAGAAALVWSYHPDWTYMQVKDALLRTVDPVEGLNGKVATGGRLNVLRALQYNSSLN